MYLTLWFQDPANVRFLLHAFAQIKTPDHRQFQGYTSQIDARDSAMQGAEENCLQGDENARNEQSSSHHLARPAQHCPLLPDCDSAKLRVEKTLPQPYHRKHHQVVREFSQAENGSYATVLTIKKRVRRAKILSSTPHNILAAPCHLPFFCHFFQISTARATIE